MFIKEKFKNLINFDLHIKLNRMMKGYKTSVAKLIIVNSGYALCSVTMALVTRTFIDDAMAGNYQLAVRYGILLGAILIIQLILLSYTSYTSVRLAETIRNGVQLRLISEIYSKKWLDLNNYKTGDLLFRLYSDIGSIVTTMTATIPQIFAFIVQFSVAFALVFSYSSMLAVIIFFVTPITLLFGLIIGHKLKVVQKKIQEADALKNAVINESLQNTIILKSFNFLSQNLQKVKMLQNAHFELVKRKNIISIRSNVMLSLGYAFGFFAAIVFGTYGLAIQGISVGTFAAIVQLVGQIQGPMQGVSKGISQYISSLSSVERLQELESLEDEWQMDKNEPQILEKPQKIVLKNVCFAYIKDKPIITNLELTVIKGEKVAIVGPSGEGKTTLILMLLALIEPDNGELFIETSKGERYNMGVNTRSCFSYVPQVNTLFSGSIYDNFLLTSAVSDEELKQALEASCCSEFLDKLPLGLGTEIGERGIGLSQGQAQRVTIARALLHNTPVLIFDEATSALDVGLERRLIENIKKFYPGCTLIAITHREGLFDICDRVYKLKNGRLYSEL